MTLNLGSSALADLPIVRASELSAAAAAPATPSSVTVAAEVSASYHPVLPGLQDLLGAPGLRCGSTYGVTSSTSLCLALLAGSSRTGRWSAVVGMPTLGAQAAAGLGIDLDRLALVPDPGEHWPEVLATLADAVDIIVTAPPARPRPGDVHRLSARLRQRGATLIVHGQPWPGSELRMSVTDSTWVGMRPDGLGHLSARHALVNVAGKGAPRASRMWLPAPDGTVRRYHADADQPAVTPRLRAVR